MANAPKTTTPIRPLFQAESLDAPTLNAKASSALPSGFGVAKLGSDGSVVELYTWTGSEWEDGINGGPVTVTSMTGLVYFVNPSSTDISFAW